MRLFRKRNKNNKGFSLVEVICAIAILSLTSTAIGSTMIMSTKNYQRGNAEVDVQKEAQTTTNLIGNLLVDAYQVNKTDTEVEPGVYQTTYMKIDGDGVTYELTYDPGTGVITYKEKRTGKASVEGVLAENVSGLLVGDLTNFKTDRKVKVDLSVDKNGRSYDASYNTSPRNTAAFNIGAEQSAIIICENDIVLEPGQHDFELPIDIYGNPSSNGFYWSALTTAGPNSEVGATSAITSSAEGVKIKLSPDAKGTLTFTISTNATKDVPGVGTIPLDTKTVTIRVRRADSISYTKTATDDLKKDCVYRIEASVGSDHIGYFDKVIGKTFDDDYKNPRYVDFDVVGTSNAKFTILNANMDEDVDAPYIEIKLDEDLPMGEKITVTMTSKHAAGSTYTDYNKSNVNYATVTNVCEIKNADQAIVPDSGIRRGNDNFVQFHNTIDVSTISSTFKGDSNYLANGNNGRYMFRFREKGTTINSPYYRLVDKGIANNKFNAEETWPWKAGLAYEIDVILVGIDNAESANPTMWFPQDDQLLSELQATYPNLQKGWTDEDAANEHACTTFAEYGGTLEIGAAIMKWKDASGNYVESIGSEVVHNGFTVNVGSIAKAIEFDGINMMTSHYPTPSYLADFYIWIDGNGGAAGHWEKIINVSNYFTYEYSNTQFKLTEVKPLASGHDFKIVPKIKDTYKTIDSYTLNSVTYSSDAIVNESVIFELANPSTGKGCIYFNVN